MPVRLQVFGNACRDVTYRVPALPRPGETILAGRLTSELGGKGLNQAIAARRIGAATRLFAVIGEDETGAQVRDLLDAEGIPADGLITKPGNSDASHIFVDPGGENFIVTIASCAAQATRDDVAEVVGQLDAGDVVLVQGNFDASLSADIMRRAHARGCRVMLNASPLWKEAQEPLRLADVLVVNRQEASALTGAGSPQEALERLTAPVAIVTAGADGAFLRNGAAAIVRYPAASVTARNTTGAGDVLAGSLAGALALGLPLAGALRIAVTLAADKVTREGVIGGFPSAEVARSLLGKERHADLEAELRNAALGLLSATAVRERARQLLGKAERGALHHFAVDLDRLPSLADAVAGLTRRRYPDLDIPCHARWRHFAVGGRDRWSELARRGAWRDVKERARAAFDLAIVSVLLDAGAGSDWSYRDGTGAGLDRSEGLAVASIDMFAAGRFSNDRADPLRVDTDRLQALGEADLAAGFQVSANNPLVGLPGRLALLGRLGAAVAERPEVFALLDRPRPGGLFDHLVSIAEGGRLAAATILENVLRHLGSLWPGRISLGAVHLGDTWRHGGIETQDATRGLMPFHKLSQWLTYSLVEPLQDAGIDVIDIDGLTGLAEYRNGGMFLDAGVVQPKDAAAYEQSHRAGDELVVEWRALTVALLDRTAPLVRQSLGMSRARLPLGKILEGGTWALGRQLAFERRPDGAPPLKIVSDGTVF